MMSKLTIHDFAESNQIDSLKEEIIAGTNINEKDAFGATALHYSIAFMNHDITRWLVKHGADVTIQNDTGATPLHHAVECNACDIAEFLLEQNRKVLDIADKHGNQPLWTAVFNARGKYEIVDLLLRYGANANHRNKVQRSPLDLAKMMNDETLVERLEKCSNPSETEAG